MSFIRTLTGRVDLFNPHPDQLSIYDLAWNLCHINRFTGAVPVRYGYSVGMHSLIGSYYIENQDYALPFLMHDASEYLLNDITYHLKRVIHEQTAIYDDLANVYDKMIREKFINPYQEEWNSTRLAESPSPKENIDIHIADRRMGITEINLFWPNDPFTYDEATDYQPLGPYPRTYFTPKNLNTQPITQVYLFLTRYAQLTNQSTVDVLDPFFQILDSKNLEMYY